MRISDWSSDVCSSDLWDFGAETIMTTSQQVAKSLPYLRRYARALTGSQTSGDNFVKATLEAIIAEPEMLEADPRPRVALYKAFQRIYDSAHIEVRSEEHTSELQSLMRISYAVFCLK